MKLHNFPRIGVESRKCRTSRNTKPLVNNHESGGFMFYKGFLERIGHSLTLMGALLFILIAAFQPTQAQTLKTIYKFNGFPDGADPVWGPTFDAQGNLWGTTPVQPGHGSGTIYKLTPSGDTWTETTAYTFPGPGDTVSWGFIVDGQGNLFNTTLNSLFVITPQGTVNTLYTFTGGADGGTLYWENLVRDALGNFYGTAAAGGTSGRGVVFRVDPSGIEDVLYSFTGGADGGGPTGGVVFDAQGNLYGTTGGGGKYKHGTVFKVTPSGVETVLHSFHSQDGKQPQGGLTIDAQGNLYGATWGGGTGHSGTVFEITSSGTYKVLYSFLGGDNGWRPNGPLTLDAQGNLYGVTFGGAGTIFQVTPTGAQQVLWNFGKPAKQSKYPTPGLVWDSQGNLYGATNGGGRNGSWGTIFRLTR
jgi:uncharacterized repeat protein (TIGR03803 family)